MDTDRKWLINDTLNFKIVFKKVILLVIFVALISTRFSDGGKLASLPSCAHKQLTKNTKHSDMYVNDNLML